MTCRSRVAALAGILGLPLLLAQRATLPGPDLGRTALSALALVAGLLLLDRVLRQIAPTAVAATATALLLFGTFLYAYGAHQAREISHSLGFLLASLALALWWERRERLSTTVSAAVLLSAFAAAALVARGMRMPRPEPVALLDTLFSSRGGLLFWTPLLWAGFLGHLALLRRDRRTALLLLLPLVTLLLAATDKAGAAGFFAGGRFDAVIVLLAPGLAVFLAALQAAATRRPAGVLVAIGLALATWNVLFMEQYRTDRIPRDATVSFAEVSENSAGVLAGLVGSPVAWPANWLFAWRHDLPASKYDVMEGQTFPPGGAIDLGDDRVDPDLVAEGWSSRKPCGVEVCRGVLGRARLFAPLDARPAVALRVRAAGAGTLAVSLNGARVAALPLSPQLSELRVPVAAALWRSGLNEIAFAAEGAGTAAAVDRVIIETR